LEEKKNGGQQFQAGNQKERAIRVAQVTHVVEHLAGCKNFTIELAASPNTHQ
jgi:hypothetical protein